jgi:cobalt/nickel transport protein
MKSILPWPKKWIAAIVILIVLTPLGILAAGEAWGEWGEVGDWVPQHLWNAPFDGYDLSGWDSQLMASFGYIISAIVGCVAIVIVTYVVYVAVAKKENKNSSK